MSESPPTASDAQVANDAPAPAAPRDTAQVVAPSTAIDELPDWAQKELRDLRKENERRRLAEKKVRDAELTELQRTAQERDELRERFSATAQELHELRARDALRIAGAQYPDILAARLSDDALNGDAKKLQAEIDALRTQYPILFRNATADGAAGRTAPQTIRGRSHLDGIESVDGLRR